MQKVLLVMPVILPVFFWAVYHYHKDRHLPEPLGHLLLTFVLGVLAAAVSQALYMALDPLALRFDAGALSESSSLGLFAYSLLAIGPIEEFSKLLFFVLIVIRFKEFDEPLDGIIYASFIGLGYAAIENWQYLDYLTPLEAAARGFASPRSCTCFSRQSGGTGLPGRFLPINPYCAPAWSGLRSLRRCTACTTSWSC